MMEGGPGGDGGYRELHPEKPKELGEVDSLNPYVEQQAAPSLKQKSCAGYFPILGWLPFYSVSKLQGDLISGLSTGAMIIPQALAYRYDSININHTCLYFLPPPFASVLLVELLGLNTAAVCWQGYHQRWASTRASSRWWSTLSWVSAGSCPSGQTP